jgi:TolB-like protein
MEADEEGTWARLKAVRKSVVDPFIASYRGRIVKTTGDGILVEYASAVDAVRSAVELQRSMAEQNAAVPQDQRIEFRIGIHIGDIIIDDNDIFGDGVNIAARLEGIAERGGVCISDDAHRQVRAKLGFRFDDMGLRALKNIAEPMRAWQFRTGDVSTADHAPAGPIPSLALPDKPSIAVLPFQNMSGDPEQEYFADGVVEDIITALSNFKSLFVIARNSTFTYKGKPIDIKQVGRELGVRYVLEGSVRKAAGRVRITGQLIEASTGNHLWAEKIDGEMREVFELQDHITAKVVSSVAPTIERAEIDRVKQRPTNTTDAYDTYLRGMALYYLKETRGARNLFKKAAAQDPEYAAAYAMSARTYSIEKSITGSIPTPEMQADCLHDANAALALANEDPYVLWQCSHPVAYICQQFDRGAFLAERAVTLNPNLAGAWTSRGWISIMQSQPERALESFEHTMRLSPLDPMRPFLFSGMAFAYFLLDRYDEGRRTAGEIMQLFPHVQSFGSYIVNCVGAGNLTEAKEAGVQLLKFDPSFRVSQASAIFPTRSPEMRKKLDNALRTAGLPE